MSDKKPLEGVMKEISEKFGSTSELMEPDFAKEFCRKRYKIVHEDDKLFCVVPLDEMQTIVRTTRKLQGVADQAVTDLQSVHDFAQTNENSLRAKIADLEESLSSQRRVVKMKPLAQYTGVDINGLKTEFDLKGLVATAYEMEMPQGTKYLLVLQTQTALSPNQRQQLTTYAAQKLAKKLGDNIVVLMLPGDGTEFTVLEMPPPYR
jgi:hypothetical protein